MDKSLRLQIIFNALDKLSGPLRGISGETKKFGKAMRETRAEVNKLEKTQGSINQFRKLKTASKETGRQLEEARAKAARLGKEIAQAEKPTKQLGRQFLAAKKQAEKLEHKLHSQSSALKESRQRLADAGISTRNLAQHQRDLSNKVKQANESLKIQGKRMQQLYEANHRAQKMKALGGAVSGAGVKASIGVTAPIAALGNAAFQAATDATELESAFEVTFGKGAKHMRDWAETTGNQLERSTQEMMAMSMAYQDILKKQVGGTRAAEMTKTLTVLTQDLASFKNLSNDVAQQKIFSGLIGEAEPLRAVGVLLSDNAVKAKAAAMGLKKVNGQYSEGDKVQARAALIMEQLKDAQGDILRTQGSTANRLKAASAAWDELKVSLGDKLLPKLTPVINAIARLLDFFANLPPGLQNFLVWAGMAAAVLGPLLLVIGGLISTLGALSAVAGVLGIGLAPLLLIIAAVVAAVGVAGYLIYKNWDKIKSAFGAGLEYLRSVWDWIKGTFQRFPWLFGPIGIAVSFIINHWNDIKAAFAAGLDYLRGAWDWIKATFDRFPWLFGPIGLAVKFVTGHWENIKAIFNTGVDFLAALPDRMLSIGKAIIDGLISGFTSGFDKVKAKVSELADYIPDWMKKPLGINSPSKVFMKLGDAIPQGLAVGIDRSGKQPIGSIGKLAGGLSGALALSASPTPALAGIAAQGVAAQGAAPITIHIHQQPGEDAQDLAERVMAQLKRAQAASDRSGYYDE